MLNQIYLNSGDTYIMCFVKQKSSIEVSKGCVVLLPGFGESANDVDYFMTRLSNKLSQENYITIQVDLYGHGDSYGDVSDLNLDIIEGNIKSVYDYARNICENKDVICIARGLYGNILNQKKFSNLFSRIICINPIITNTTFKEIMSNDLLEISDLIKDNNIKDLFLALGSELTNLKGQKISSKFLCEIFTLVRFFDYDGKTIILSSYNQNCLINNVKNYRDICLEIKSISEYCFVRDVNWQAKLINEIEKYI